MTARTREHWYVRQVVPIAFSRTRRFEGYTIERVRGPRRGIDRGLYVIRTADGQSRTAVLRGIQSNHELRPHLVYRLRERLELGTQLASYWPDVKDMPRAPMARDAVGDFDDAVAFACQVARHDQLTLVSSTLEHSDD